MLTLEVEYLTGVCFAASSHASSQPDWPPQPDRLFSALVAAWGGRGERPEEKSALEWLEHQPSPLIEASDASARAVLTSYVPPNDPKGNIEVMPERRRRQARMFPAAIPHRPVARFRWALKPNSDTFDALQAVAGDTAYLGHSASLVRCRFVLDATPDADLKQISSSRRIYPGRLQALQTAYTHGQRPLPGEVVLEPSPESRTPLRRSLFSNNWIILEDAGGRCPDIRGIAVVARRLRDALMSRYGAAGFPIPELVSGHKPDGGPTSDPHVAIVPMSDVGSYYSEGRLMGLALVLPNQADEERRKSEHEWLAGLDDPAGRIAQWRRFDRFVAEVDRLELGSLGVWHIARSNTSLKKSLQPERYIREAKRWSSATPIALDRFPKAKAATARDKEIAGIIRSSCLNIGLPEPETIRILKHAAIKGVPSAYPSGNAPAWTGWTLPGALAGRMLTHAVLQFSEPVCGPVILGSGRFVGLGLCIATES